MFHNRYTNEHGGRAVIIGLLVVSLSILPIACGKDKTEKPAESAAEISATPQEEGATSTSQQKALQAIDKGLAWLQKQQNVKGGFHAPIGMTSLVVTVFLKHPEQKYSPDDPFLRKALDYIVSVQHPDGAIYDENDQPALPNYNTSISLMALSAAKDPRYDEVIQKAQNYVTGIQVADESSIYYGGIGYGSDPTSRDLSNLNIALQGLKESGLPEDHVVWERAVAFLNKVQNNLEVNKASWAGNDGGFVYMPGTEQNLDRISKAGVDEEGRPRSYASMTYAGLLSFIYANVDKNDDRVQAALQWIKDHYTLDENYGLGKEGLFYNYHTMAKALSSYGEPIITDSKGVQHDWYAELVDKLVSLQREDGYWINESDRWFEQDPVLVTAYAVLALETGYPK